MAVIDYSNKSASLLEVISDLRDQQRRIGVAQAVVPYGVMFSGSKYGGSGENFIGHISYSNIKIEPFNYDSEVSLPDELKNNSIFIGAVFDPYTPRVYFSSYLNDKPGYVVVDAENQKYVNTIYVDNDINEIPNAAPAISRIGNMYIPNDNNQIVCYNLKDNSITGYINLKDSKLFLENISGCAVDNRLDVLYVVSSYAVPEKKNEYFCNIKSFNTINNKQINSFDIQLSDFFAQPIINQDFQLMYLSGERQIQVIDLINASHKHSIRIDDHYRIMSTRYDPIDNCLAVVTDGSAAYIVFNPETPVE